MGKMNDPNDPVTKIAMKISEAVKGDKFLDVASAAAYVRNLQSFRDEEGTL